MEKADFRYFEALREAAGAINSTLKSDEVLSRIVRTTVLVTNAQGCSLMLLDDERKSLVHRAAFGLSDQYLHKGVLVADQSIADTLKGEPAIVSDVSNDPRVQYPAEALKEGIASIISIPLTTKGVITGELRVYFREKQGVVPVDMIRLLGAIADLAAIAIQNSVMYDSLKKAHEIALRELWHLQP